MAGRYGSEPKIQSKMVEEAQKVRGATKRILEAGQQLQQNAMHKEVRHLGQLFSRKELILVPG